MFDSSETIKVVFLDRATISPQTRVRPLVFKHEYIEHASTAPGEVASRIADADVVITNKVRISSEAINAAQRLKLIAVAATGTDNIDLAACTQKGIVVSNIRNYAANTVPEHTFALILALRRSLLAYRDSVRAGRWEQSGQFCFFDHPIHDLAGSVLGIIGDGVLGQRVAACAQAFGMKVLFSSYKGREGMGALYTPFEEVLRRSDIITLHLPLLPSTTNLIDTREFALMERRPLLINTARGGLVNELALEQALQSGQVSGAGFDVVTEEPLTPDNPLSRLLDRPNFILTPHVAWASAEAIQGLTDQLIDNVEAFWRGEPVNRVNS